MTCKDWLTETKNNNPDLSEFITKLESFISDTGLNCVKFEKAVNIRLQTIEAEINKSFNPLTDAQTK